MGLEVKILAVCVGFGFLLFVLISIRRNMLRPSFAVLWISISFFLLSIPLLEPLYKSLANVVGISDARHVIYIALIGFLLVYVFYLSLRISCMSDRIQILLSQLAIVECELDRRATIQPSCDKLDISQSREDVSPVHGAEGF
jgi:hypothetical protein